MEKKQGNRKHMPEWRRYGDPRNIEGCYRPKRNLKTLYGKGKKWTRESLAEAMGIKDASVISRWVSGKRYMSDDDVMKCALAANVSVTWLLDFTDKPSAQAWPNQFVDAQRRIIAGIKMFSDGKSREQLAQDYHKGVAAVKEYRESVEAYILEHSGCKDMEEFRRMKHDEIDGNDYEVISEEAWSYPSPLWSEEFVEDEDGREYHTIVTVSQVDYYIQEIERRYPGDHRDPVHLAHAMLDSVMDSYPSRCLEQLTGLFNQVARMRADV